MDNDTKNERKIVTILFADIVDFSGFSESHDPEIVTELLEKVLKIGTNIILRYGGYVDKYIGDCIMALFGAPIAKENDSKNAILAAIDIIEEIKKLNTTLKYPLNIRIGIHTGLVIAGYIGPKGNRQYTVIGHAVNVAKRIQEEGKSNKIYVSESSYNATNNYFNFKKINFKLFKGLTKSIQIFEVVSTRKDIINKAPFIGRKEYLNKLIKAYKSAENGKLQVISVIGEKGAGKSKLMDLFKNYLSDKSVVLRFGMGINTQKYIPYSGVINILKINLGIQGLQNRKKISKILKDKLNKFERYYIGILLSISSTREYMQSKVLNDGIYTSLKSILTRLSKKSTFILIVENADYIDTLSIEILNRLIGELKNIKALVIITSTTRIIDFGKTIHLKPFSKREATIFIQSISPYKIGNEIINSIYNKTKGNPLFIEEILKDPNIGKTDLSIPFSIHESIMARVDRLNAPTKNLLQYATVLGYVGDIDILKNIVNLSGIKFDNALNDLIRSGFLSKISKNKYTFLHPLVHEIIYNSLLIRIRKSLHYKIAKIIEIKYSSNIDIYYEILAQHYSLAEDKHKSLHYLIKSADKSLSLYNLKSAINYYKKSLTIAKSIKDKNSCDYIALKIGDVYYQQSNFVISLRWYKKILKDESLINSGLYYKALIGTAMNYERKGKYKKTISILNSILTSLKENNLTKAKAFQLLSVSYFRLARYRISLDYAFKARKIAIKKGSLQETAKANAFIGHCYRFLGDFSNSEKYHKENLEIGELTNDLTRIAYTYDSLASIYRDRGDYKKALKYLKESLSLTIKMDHTLNTGDVYSDIAEVYILLKDYNNGYRYLNMAKKIFKKIGFLYELIILNRRFAFYYFKLRKYIRSAKYAKDALNLAKKSGEKLEEGRLSLLLGEIYYNIGKSKPARNEVSQAIDIFKNANAIFYLNQANSILKNVEKASIVKV